MHEFQPLTSGYRIYLSYHLVHIGQGPTPEVSTTSKSSFSIAQVQVRVLIRSTFAGYYHCQCVIQLVDTATQVTRIIKLIEKWRVPTKVVYILEYKYLDVGLAFKTLKNRDRAVAEILKRARIDSGYAFELYLCLIKVRFSSLLATRSIRYIYSS